MLTGLLAIDRETAMVTALASLCAAGVVFAVGAVVMYLRERRAARAARVSPSPEQGGPQPG